MRWLRIISIMSALAIVGAFAWVRYTTNDNPVLLPHQRTEVQEPQLYRLVNDRNVYAVTAKSGTDAEMDTPTWKIPVAAQRTFLSTNGGSLLIVPQNSKTWSEIYDATPLIDDEAVLVATAPDGRYVHSAAWTSDGKRLAFTTSVPFPDHGEVGAVWEYEPVENRYTLLLRRRFGLKVIPRIEGWLADGRLLVSATPQSPFGEPQGQFGHLLTIEPDGDRQAFTLPGGTELPPFDAVAETSAPPQMLSGQLNSSGTKWLYTSCLGEVAVPAGFSQDGTYFLRGCSQGATIDIYDFETEATTTLYTTMPFNVESTQEEPMPSLGLSMLSWRNDDTILFATQAGLFSINVNETELVRIAEGPMEEDLTPPGHFWNVFHAGERYIVYQNEDGATVLDIESGESFTTWLQTFSEVFFEAAQPSVE